MRPRTYKTEAIIIKRFNFSEADKILTVFSKHYGKISCLAKGIRKPTSRKSASLELFNLVAIFLAKGKNLDIITEVEVIDPFSVWRKNLHKVGLAYQFSELVDRLTGERQENRQVFELLKQSLSQLKEKEINKEELMIDFKSQLLETTGFGLPKEISNKTLDRYLESIMEKKINSNSLLKRIRE